MKLYRLRWFFWRLWRTLKNKVNRKKRHEWFNSNMVASLCGLSVAFYFSNKNKSGESSFENPYDETSDFGDFYCELDGYMVDISALDWRKPSVWKEVAEG